MFVQTLAAVEIVAVANDTAFTLNPIINGPETLEGPNMISWEILNENAD